MQADWPALAIYLQNLRWLNTVSIITFLPAVVPNSTKVADEEKKFRDCADLHQAGFHKSGVYTIQINPQETKKVGSHNIARPNATD